MISLLLSLTFNIYLFISNLYLFVYVIHIRKETVSACESESGSESAIISSARREATHSIVE